MQSKMHKYSYNKKWLFCHTFEEVFPEKHAQQPNGKSTAEVSNYSTCPVLAHLPIFAQQ
jgi:hypothetical protein